MKVKLILKRAILIIAVLAVISWFIWQIPAAKKRLTTQDFWTFDIASFIAIGFTAWAVYLQKEEIQEQRTEITKNREVLEQQKEQTQRLADLTEQTAKATRLQTEIEFCKKIECQMVYMFHGTIPSVRSLDGQTYEMQLGYFMNKFREFTFGPQNSRKYKILYEQLKDYLKIDSQLYDYYLSATSAFTILYNKCKEFTKSQ
jgi:hypothetical protein